jgi:hypothetical protein
MFQATWILQNLGGGESGEQRRGLPKGVLTIDIGRLKSIINQRGRCSESTTGKAFYRLHNWSL